MFPLTFDSLAIDAGLPALGFLARVLESTHEQSFGVLRRWFRRA
jgi:hypothetical protein